MDLLHLLEPEETVGNIWHRMIGDQQTCPRFPEYAATFDSIEGRLRVYFHALGGDPSVELGAAFDAVSHHRLSWRQRLGRRSERAAEARFNGERLNLPATIDAFPDRGLNECLYYWLAAWSAVADESHCDSEHDPLASDVMRLRAAAHATQLTLETFPGIRGRYEFLRQATLALRPRRALPKWEAAVEAAIRQMLGDTEAKSELFEFISNGGSYPRPLTAPKGYRPFLPIPLWVEVEARPERQKVDRDDEADGDTRRAGGDGKLRRAKRRSADEINRINPLVVHRFEKILTWTEFMNLHRDVEDSEEENARKAVDDHDEIGVAKINKRAATRLKVDLDLAPADVDVERISDVHTYPEWDHRRQGYLPDHTRVLDSIAPEEDVTGSWKPNDETRRRIRMVRRQFEALRPKREILGRQLDGHELDMDALIRSAADFKARGSGSDQVYRQAREQSRDLSVAILIDVSRSTESYVDNRPVIEIEKEALTVLAEGIAACGDEAAIMAFSSLRRDKVFVKTVKDYAEPVSPAVHKRIAALRPGFYTRLGAAIRHASATLSKRSMRRRLLLVLTDGKPNDLDHYEGRYGIEDSRKAIQEARRAGHAAFGITVDSKAQNYFPRIFGAQAFSIISHPSRLSLALPMIYRHLVQ